MTTTLTTLATAEPAQPQVLHPESLLHLHPVRQMMQDPGVRKVARAIDAHWSYEEALPVWLSGFNHFESSIYFARNSFLARWLEQPEASARDLNEGDFLVREVLFAAHDYLHVWATQMMQALRPEIGFGTAPITPDNLEDHAFLHLTTEAVATVGLDYWYLATFDINDRVPIGTDRELLTVDYREDNLQEFRRANPSFAVQTPEFFTELSTFYSTGVLHGFDVHDLRRSAQTFKWLRHELSYGATQRQYTRAWLRYLATGEARPIAKADAAPIAADAAWQQELLAELGENLWRKIKEDADICPGPQGGTPWRAPSVGRPDFRFTNVNAIDLEDLDESFLEVDSSASYLLHQLIARYDFRRFDPDLRQLLPAIVKKKDVGLLQRLFRSCPLLEAEADEPRDLLLLN